MPISDRCASCGFTYGLTTRDGQVVCDHCGSSPARTLQHREEYRPDAKARRSTLDVHQQCVLVASVLASLERVLQKNGLEIPDGSKIGVAYKDTRRLHDPYKRARQFAEQDQPLSALREFIVFLRGMASNGCFVSSATNDQDREVMLDIYILVSDEGIVLNEARVLWWTMEFVAKLLPCVGESELFAELFVLVFSKAECDCDTARSLLPTLLLSHNGHAIELAAQTLRAKEPLAQEVAQADARARQLAVDEHAAPLTCMSGTEFEKLLERHFVGFGFVVERIGRSGDFGADLLLKTVDGTVIAVQAKRWQGRANLKAVQEVHGAVSYYHADVGIVVCSGGFYPSAKGLAESSGVELWGKEHVVRFLDGDIAFSMLAPLARP